MRVKDDATRAAIIHAALHVFTRNGYERSSMDSVADRAGCVKATVYNYFPSKEALLLEAMRHYAATFEQNVFADLDGILDAKEAVLRLAVGYLKFQLSPNMIALVRLAFAEGKRNSLGKTVYEDGIRAYWIKVAALLARMLEPKCLPAGGVWQAAMQLKALLDAEPVTRALLGVKETFSAPEIKRMAEAGCEVFFRAYPPLNQKRKG